MPSLLSISSSYSKLRSWTVACGHFHRAHQLKPACVVNLHVLITNIEKSLVSPLLRPQNFRRLGWQILLLILGVGVYVFYSFIPDNNVLVAVIHCAGSASTRRPLYGLRLQGREGWYTLYSDLCIPAALNDPPRVSRREGDDEWNGLLHAEYVFGKVQRPRDEV